MRTHIQKWGNSLGVRIPRQIAKKLQLHPGSPVTIEVDNDRMIIQSPKYDLDMMLNDITEENQHREILDDEAQGKEEW